MPFLSPDWRFPGEKWLKSNESGSNWENAKICRLRIFESVNENYIKRLCRRSVENVGFGNLDASDEVVSFVVYQPHIFLTAGVTKEICTATTISEALLKLDMKAAIRDIRRFNYVCRILNLLIQNHFSALSGRLQLFIIALLREVLLQVKTSCNQTALFRRLLSDLRETLEKNKFDHIGSAVLWQNHWKALDELNNGIESFNISEKIQSVAALRHLKPRSLSENGTLPLSSGVTLEQLPVECLSHVLANLHCPQDLQTASLASNTLADLVDTEYLWRTLTLKHFTMDQISSVLFGRAGWRDQPAPTIAEYNWRRAYQRLVRRYGDQHFYPAKLAICELCSCLFWPIFGHPCYQPSMEPKWRVLSPDDFIRLFAI